MKIEKFDARKNVTSAVVSINAQGMVSVLINMATKTHLCSYQGYSLNLLRNDKTDGAIPKHVCFRVSPGYSEVEYSDDGTGTEVVVIAETPAEDLLLNGLHYESQCKEQHEILFVPKSMLVWQQAALTTHLG